MCASHRNLFYFLCFGYIIFLINFKCVYSSEQGEAIQKWADKLGKELYDLGRAITKSDEIKQRYFTNNAQVEKKNAKELLAEIVENVSRMVDRKMDAVRCIVKVAENASEAFEYKPNTNYTYYNSKYSPVSNKTYKLPEALEANRHMYLNMSLNNDTHFYNVPVNTEYSSVHVPINIYDRHKDAQSAIQWSEELDEVFIQNYNSDPALSWQYFGSSSGIMRHYPAMHWINDDIDLFDCRIRTWFIEAATCTKDVIILVDNSGSMQGMRKHIASTTINSILDTFSNNDYINVMNYSTHVNFTVPCFNDILVQATTENIATFKKAVAALDPDNKSDSAIAFAKAFELLGKYREKKGCTENSSDCNQAIMLVTDGIAGNISEVFEMYNRGNNGTTIPVRIFTYLIGAEVTKVNEIMWAACSNKGYYSHVQSLVEVSGSVFRYIPVIARPLVLQADDHPPSWTHAYADLTYNDKNDYVYNEPYRLLTSVAVPAFDRKSNRNNESRTADLLGVAATDVPIDDIAKLTMPYKLGVMAYSFIVTNNGYVLMHPSLRPVFNKTILKENYNSVDFAEVEQHDDDLPPREINPTVIKLRNALVAGAEGELRNAKLKYHYDNMRRISRQEYNYYYAPISETPFTIGIAIPKQFGDFSILVGDEIQRNRHTGIDITNYFQGCNWKIHPKWVYCKYHYLEGHEFKTPETELLHFLDRMYDKDFKWERQYEATAKHKHEEYDIELEDNDEIECGRKLLEDDDYYCDQDLIQRLIFDAKNTYLAFDKPWTFNNDREELLFKNYNATLRFAATMSGLTRWEYIYGEDESDINKMEFGDYHSRAIDETWYKSAVLQHQHDPNSFVYSVPYEVGDANDILVTGSFSIFPKDAGIEAPGSVVGFQFSHKHMEKRFVEITTVAENSVTPCGDLLDCYLVDSAGYVLISHNKNETGQFFGEIEGAVMEAMLKVKIFQKIVIYDFQGLCFNETDSSSDVGYLQTPLDIGKGIINYILGNVVWLLFKSNLYTLWDPNMVYGDEMLTTIVPNLEEDEEEGIDVETEDEEEEEEEELDQSRLYPCDLQRDLFILQQNLFIKGHGWFGEVPSDCPRHFFVKRIPHSNLILVAVNTSNSMCDQYYTTAPKDVEYPNGIEHPCQKLELNSLPRRRLSGCYNEHPLEEEIRTCGRSTKLNINVAAIFLALIAIII